MGVSVGVAGCVGVLEGSAVGVASGVGVLVGSLVAMASGVGVLVGSLVAVASGVGVLVGSLVAVAEGDGLACAVFVAAALALDAEGVEVGVGRASAVFALVKVGLSVLVKVGSGNWGASLLLQAKKQAPAAAIRRATSEAHITRPGRARGVTRRKSPTAPKGVLLSASDSVNGAPHYRRDYRLVKHCRSRGAQGLCVPVEPRVLNSCSDDAKPGSAAGVDPQPQPAGAWP